MSLFTGIAKKSQLALGVFMLFLTCQGAQAGILFVGSDHREFSSLSPDWLGRFTTAGPAITGGGIINTNYVFNGLGEGNGFLYAGQYNTNTLRRIDYSGNSLSTFAAAIPNSAFNEDLAGDGTYLYAAHYVNQIRKLDAAGNLIEFDTTGLETLGVAVIGNDVWISDWSGKKVGIWNFATNTFTSKFSTPNFAGGLAYDPESNVLWVGMRGGLVVPYNPVTGTAINAGFQPFGAINDTIDGLAFVTNIPEPGTLSLLAMSAAGLLAWRRRRGTAAPR